MLYLHPILHKYQPKYLVHGHVHMSYGHNIPREIDYHGTKVINAYERYVLEIPDVEIQKTKKKGDIDYGYYSE